MAKTLSTGTAIVMTATSSNLILPNIGQYELSIYILMYAIGDLSSGDDYMKISLFYSNDALNSFTSETYDYTNLGIPNAWNRKILKFNAENTNIQVIKYFLKN